MSSHAFLAGTPFGRSGPMERGSSFGGGPDDIPIDPALSGLPLDPALVGDGGDAGYTKVSLLNVPAGALDAVVHIARVASRFRETSLG